MAGRLAEDRNDRILLVEAGPHSKDLENVHMIGGFSKLLDAETDWNIVTPPMQGVDGRQVKLSRGKVRFSSLLFGCFVLHAVLATNKS